MCHITKSLSAFLPKDRAKLKLIDERFYLLDKSQQSNFIRRVLELDLKEPLIVIWGGNFALGFIGLNYFMLGKNGYGILRVVFTFLTILFFILSFSAVYSESYQFFSVYFMGFLLFFSLNSVWCLVDMFTMGNYTRNHNYNKIINLLKKDMK
ncbi:hypothetical protein [Campylobacter corcagiensis]|uniref:TM2 domain-containing protein n=1 Tax=Campylobacter corcagiensis TaxID=1448857 RepID=A0A7M1LJT1_9BACT|nr:hypothetical protein [Campylobacter corcagiensis]QKF65357.1 putative membrane protein [Campylobacter corcagiensis]QOQ88066.1 hypothetical protein IMC76_04555 [Campylobacter corcagiensis]